MTSRVYISGGEAMSLQDELASMRQTNAKEPTQWGVKQGNFQRVEVNAGHREQPVNMREVTRPGYVVVNQPDPDKVTINGIETSRKVAVNMGWISQQEPQPGQSANPFGEAGEAPEQQEQQPDAQSDNAVEDAGNKALDELSQGFAGDTFATAIEAAESGDFDAIAAKYGLDPSKVAVVVSGATARADRVISDMGVNSATLSAVLDVGELAEARRAVVQGDDARLRSVAELAVNKLSTMPTRDPAGFKAFFNRHFSDIESDIGPGGQFLVNVEGMGFVPWSTVVQLGGVKLKG